MKDKMTQDEHVIAKLQIGLEVDTDDYSMGQIKGFIEGFKKGSQVEKADGTELCFITKIIIKKSEIESFEFCEVIKNKDEKP